MSDPEQELPQNRLSCRSNQSKGKWVFRCPCSSARSLPAFITPITEVPGKQLSGPSQSSQPQSCLPLRLITSLALWWQPASQGLPSAEARCSTGWPSTGKSEGLALHLPSRLLGRLLRSCVGMLARKQAGFWLKPAWQASCKCACVLLEDLLKQTHSHRMF